MSRPPFELPKRSDGHPELDDIVVEPDDFLMRLEPHIEAAGGELQPDTERLGSIGATMFDLPSSEDNATIVLLPRETMQQAPSQALVRIRSADGRSYLGIVTAGPFAEPDSLRGDSHMLVTVATRGGIFLPPYHGRVEVSILGEELNDGSLVPPRLRPLPNSPVFVLDDHEAETVLRTDGEIRLGLVVGYENVVVGIPARQKSVLPRHTAVLGTTGGGKSTTVSRIIQQAQQAGMAVIVLDVEGEYTFAHEPTNDPHMLAALDVRRLPPEGLDLQKTRLYHLIGRETANPGHPNLRPFSLQFARLSPYAVAEILEMSDAQQDRFFVAYEIAKALLRELKVFPAHGDREQERIAAELDEFDRGYPRLTLQNLLDVVGECLAKVAKSTAQARSPEFSTEEGQQLLHRLVQQADLPGSSISWKALIGKLGRLSRIRVFDPPSGARPIHYGDMLKPGVVSIVDLSESGASQLNNIVIADLLKGLQDTQDEVFDAYETGQRAGRNADPPTPVLVIIEEAHEFLSAERISAMPTLFEHLVRMAKRGRKRWLGLMFVTQLPQHLPSQILGLVNSYVLHKITDPQVVSTLKRTVSGIDTSLWQQLPGLAPGQAIVSFPHMARPLLVAVDPTPVKLKLVD